MLSEAVAQSSIGSVVMCHVPLVLTMTSLHIKDNKKMCAPTDSQFQYSHILSKYSKLLAVRQHWCKI